MDKPVKKDNKMKQIDTRGLSCPQPVMLVSRAIKEDSSSLEILVDGGTASENILRTLEQFDLTAEVSQTEDYKTFIVNR